MSKAPGGFCRRAGSRRLVFMTGHSNDQRPHHALRQKARAVATHNNTSRNHAFDCVKRRWPRTNEIGPCVADKFEQ